MINVEFLGVPLGARFRGAVSQYALTVNFDLPNWGITTGAATVAITAHRGVEHMAPEGVYFTSTVEGFAKAGPVEGEVYDPSKHELYYFWDFGEAHTYSGAARLPTEFRDANIAYGPYAARVYAAGTRTATLTVIDENGLLATDSVTLTSKDPATEYSGTNTICYSTTGNYANKPSDAQEATSEADALLKLDQLGGVGRILLRAGEEYNFDNTFIDNRYANFHLGSYDTGDRPIVNTAMASSYAFRLNSNFVGKDATLHGIALKGPWDADTETPQIGKTPPAGVLVNNPGYAVVHDCTFSGHGTGVGGLGLSSQANNMLFISDVSSKNYQNFAAYYPSSDGGKVALLGSEFRQSQNAMMGGGSKDSANPRNEHGGFRVQGTLTTNGDHCYIDGCDFFSRAGWDTKAPPLSNPALRLHQNNSLSNCSVNRTIVEGGYRVISIGPASSGTNPLPMNTILDKLIVVATAVTGVNIGVDSGGTTIRNTLSIKPDIATFSISFGGHIAGDSDAPNDPSNPDEKVSLYNNIYVTLHDDTNGGVAPDHVGETGFEGVFTNFHSGNSLNYSPNTSTAVNAGMTLDTTEIFTSDFIGFKWQASAAQPDEPVQLDMGETYEGLPVRAPAGSIAWYQPVAGASGADHTGHVAFDDLLGQRRPGTGTLTGTALSGAFEIA